MIAQRVAALEPRVPRVLFPAVLGATSQTILLDGSPLLAESEGAPFDKPIRINPGKHSARWLVGFRSGLVDVTVSFTVAESEIRSVEVPPEVRDAATAPTPTGAIPSDATPPPPFLTAAISGQPEPIPPREGVTIHFIGKESDGWFVKSLSTGQVLCDIPCVQVVRPETTLQLGRLNSPFDSVMVPITGNKPGSALDVKPYGGVSAAPGLVMMLGGVALSVGAGLSDGLACSDSACSGGVKTGLLVGAGVGVAAFIGGLVTVIWEANHTLGGADVSRRSSALTPSPKNLAITF